MRAEILVVGNELLNGTTLDTNSFWLSKELAKTGVKVERKTTVRDELSAISLAFKQCISRKPDWVFSAGGLGPTYDDMTVRGPRARIGQKIEARSGSCQNAQGKLQAKGSPFQKTRQKTRQSKHENGDDPSRR